MLMELTTIEREALKEMIKEHMVRNDMAVVIQHSCECEISFDGDCDVISIGRHEFDGTDWEMGWKCGLCGEYNIHNPVEHLVMNHRDLINEINGR